MMSHYCAEEHSDQTGPDRPTTMAQTTMTVDTAANKCCDRLKHGKEVTQFIADLIKARIAIEEEYASKLLKLGQQEDTGKVFGIGMGKKGATVTTGTLGNSLQTFLQSTQHLALIHNEMKSNLLIRLQAVYDFQTKQEQQRKPLADNTNRLYKQLTVNFNKLLDSKADRKAKEVKLNEKLSERDVIPKESSKYEKAHKLWEKAETALKNAQTQLEYDDAAYKETRKQWENHSIDTYSHFKKLEKARIDNSKCALWSIANIQSIAAVATDNQLCHNDFGHKRFQYTQSAVVRESLKNCKSSIDIKEVVPEVVSEPDKASPMSIRSQSTAPSVPDVVFQRNGSENRSPTHLSSRSGPPPQPPARPNYRGDVQVDQPNAAFHQQRHSGDSMPNGGAAGNPLLPPQGGFRNPYQPQTSTENAHKIAEELKMNPRGLRRTYEPGSPTNDDGSTRL